MDASWIETGDGSSIAVTTDTNGDSYILGTFQGTLTIGSSTLTSNSEPALFLGKYDTNGDGLWGLIIGYFLAGFTIDGNGALTVDTEGNVFGVVGYVGSTVRYTVDPLYAQQENRSSVAIFRVKPPLLGGPGPQVKYVQILVHDNTQHYRIATDDLQNVFVGGTFYGTLNTGNGIYTTSEKAIIILSLNPEGAYNWTKISNVGVTQEVENDPDTIILLGITFTNGKIYFTGSYTGEVFFEGFTLTTTKIFQEYVGSLEASSGALLKFCDLNYTPDPTYSSVGQSLSYTDTHVYQASIVYPFDIKNAAAFIFAFRKFDTDLVLQWERFVDMIELEDNKVTLVEISTDVNGNTNAFGTFSEDITFGGFPLSAENVVDHYVARLDDAGNWTGAILVTGKIKFYGKDVSARVSDTASITGTYQGELKVGTMTVMSENEQFFLSKIE